MEHEPQPRYPRWLITGLIFGEHDCPDWCNCGQETHDAEEWCWSRLRARMEADGDLESGAVSLVLDLERGLLALHQRHPQAAVAVLAQMFFEPSEPTELADVFGRHYSHRRTCTKATAWIAAYLSGLPVHAARGSPSCETAWRSAR